MFEDDETRTLNEQNKVFDIWWEKPGLLYPYLIYSNETPAGFALVAKPPYTSEDCDFYLSEFFVMRSFRGSGIAGIAAQEVFNRHIGNWQLQTNPTYENLRAQQFWRKTLQEYIGASYQNISIETPDDGLKMVFTFNNRLK